MQWERVAQNLRAVKEARNNLIARTIDVWQQRVGGSLSDHEAKAIIENVSGFFNVLLEWEATEKERQAGEPAKSSYAKSA